MEKQLKRLERINKKLNKKPPKKNIFHMHVFCRCSMMFSINFFLNSSLLNYYEVRDLVTPLDLPGLHGYTYYFLEIVHHKRVTFCYEIPLSYVLSTHIWVRREAILLLPAYIVHELKYKGCRYKHSLI